MDYGEIKAAVQPVVEDLDHRHLGTWKDLEGYVDDVGINCWGVHWLPYDFNSTSENLLLAIAKQLPDSFAWSSLTLKETCTCEAILQREEFQGDSNAK
jgi:6-pyruvoyl-tetrahydropterin synthase